MKERSKNLISGFLAIMMLVSLLPAGFAQTEMPVYETDFQSGDNSTVGTTPAAPWAKAGSGGTAIIALDPEDPNHTNKAIYVNKTVQNAFNLSYSPANGAVVADVACVEFDIKMRGADGDALDVQLRSQDAAVANGAWQAIVSYSFRQNAGIYARTVGTIYAPISNTPKLSSTDDYVRVRVEVGFEEGNKFVKTYIGGDRKSVV